MLSKKEKIGAEQMSRHRDMYLSRAFNKLDGTSGSLNVSKVCSTERLLNGDKKMAAEQSMNQYSKETAVTDNLLKLPDIDNIMQKNSLNSTPEPSNE